MTERTATTDRRPWRTGFLVAMTLGLVTVAGFYAALGLTFGSAEIPPDEWPILLIQVLLAASAFAIISLVGIRTKLAWIVAVLLTVCFWAALYVSVLIAARDQTGANIGMGWIMILSPGVVAGGAWLAAELTSARPGR